MSLPPTTSNLFLHILQVGYAIMICEAADQQSPPHLHFAKFVWGINGDFLILANANQLTEPPELIQIIACKCIATGTTCSTKSAVVIVREFHAQFKVVGTFSHKI